MGSTSFGVVQFGTDMGYAYAEAQAAAEREYGHQEGYSGHINCARGSLRQTRLLGVDGDALLKMKQESQKKELHRLRAGDFEGVYDIMRLHDDDLLRRESDATFGVDFGIVYYISLRVKRNTLSKRRFPAYVVLDQNGQVVGQLDGRFESSFESKIQGLAKKFGAGTYYVGNYLKNQSWVPVWQYAVTRTESRRQSAGCIPVHMYWFVGWASE